MDKTLKQKSINRIHLCLPACAAHHKVSQQSYEPLIIGIRTPKDGCQNTHWHREEEKQAATACQYHHDNTLNTHLARKSTATGRGRRKPPLRGAKILEATG